MVRSDDEKNAFLGNGPLVEGLLMRPTAQTRRYVPSPLFASLGLVIAAVFGFLCFFAGQQFPNNQACARQYTTWSPARSVIRYQPRRIEGSFFAPSKYRGPPSAEIDAAWDHLWQIGRVPIRLQDSDLIHLGKSPNRNWSRIPEELGGGIRGYPDVFHQLHCVNTLRKASYKEYYTHDKLFADPEHISRNHVDHCIEILRQQLMCAAEMVPTLTEELEGHELPQADFTTNQVCRNFEELYAWTEATVIHGGGNWDIPGSHHGH